MIDVQQDLGARGNDPREMIADQIPRPVSDASDQPAVATTSRIEPAPLKENEFRVGEVPPSGVLLAGVVAVFDVDGGFCATQAACPHRQGPLNEGTLDGSIVTCPWHGSQFDVCTGAVLHGPAKDPLETYQVTVEGEVGRVELPPADAVKGA